MSEISFILKMTIGYKLKAYKAEIRLQHLTLTEHFKTVVSLFTECRSGTIGLSIFH